jgi:N-acetylglucosaminyl-diphospho-decaprenol L-rhamnosyltransferase
VQPILSVIIVAYKSRAEIGACLGSLPQEIEGRPVEVIVVDNFPADGTSAFVRSEYPQVVVINPGENLGFGRANNLGFARSSGACVLFLNPDTISNEPALAHGVHRVLVEREIGLISPRLVQADGSMDLACRRSIPTLWDGFCRASGLATAFPHSKCFSGYNLTHLPEDGTYDVGAINGAFMLGRREVFERVAEGKASDATGGTPVLRVRGASNPTGGTPVLRGCGAFDPTGGTPVPREAVRYRLPVFDESFFMYGDDLDLCIRVRQAGYRIVYDGRHTIVHLKGLSVGRDYDRMSVAIFDANRDVYLKHFGKTVFSRLKWRAMFGAWKRLALLRARLRGHRRVQPV